MLITNEFDRVKQSNSHYYACYHCKYDLITCGYRLSALKGVYGSSLVLETVRSIFSHNFVPAAELPSSIGDERRHSVVVTEDVMPAPPCANMLSIDVDKDCGRAQCEVNPSNGIEHFLRPPFGKPFIEKDYLR